MLKLEKASLHSEINVSLRDKDYFFSRSLIFSFAIAAGLHLLFLLIFQVSPFKIRWNETTIFPPIEVEADAAFQDLALLVEMDASPKLASGLPFYPASTPLLSMTPSFSAAQPIEYLYEQKSFDNPFVQIENNIYQPSFTPLAKTELPPLSLFISGPLASRDLIPEPLSNQMLKELKTIITNESEIRVIYSVMVDGSSGQIFWYEPNELSNSTPLNRLAEIILKGLQFDKEKDTFVSSGEVELHFNLGSI